MGKCLICGEKGATISDGLGVCLMCIRKKPEQVLEVTRRKHADSHAAFGLPPAPPRDADGLRCGTCANDCVISAGRSGFCGLVWNVDECLVRYGVRLRTGFWNGIMMSCRPTVSAGGFVQAALEGATPSMLTSPRLNTDTATWPFSTEPAVTTVSIARIGTTGRCRRSTDRLSALKLWRPRRMSAFPVSAILAATPLHRCRTRSRLAV